METYVASAENQRDSAGAGIVVSPPSLSLPKGGCDIHGIGEKFAANPVTGTASMTIPISASPGRSGFGPQLALSYDYGVGNGPFGFGWNHAVPAITRKTDKGLPRYQDAILSETFHLSGSEDLVPVLTENQDNWQTQSVSREPYGRSYRVLSTLDRRPVRPYRALEQHIGWDRRVLVLHLQGQHHESILSPVDGDRYLFKGNSEKHGGDNQDPINRILSRSTVKDIGPVIACLISHSHRLFDAQGRKAMQDIFESIEVFYNQMPLNDRPSGAIEL